MVDSETLLKEISADVLGALKKHRNDDIPAQVLRGLASEISGTTDESHLVRVFLAAYPYSPSRVLDDLFAECSKDDVDEATAEGYAEVLSRLADNPRTPKTTLQQLAKSESVSVRKAVAASRCISPQCAMILIDDQLPEVRAVLAANSFIPAKCQTQLSMDPVPFVRSALLQSSHLDDEIYPNLADDVDPTVQAMTLLSQRVPVDTMLQCADSDEHFSQQVLLARKNLPNDVLESLCFSSHPDVQKVAVSRKILTIDEMLGFASRGDVDVRIKIASLPNVPEIVQQTLANDSSRDVRLALAGCPVLTEDAARTLASTDDDGIIVTLARNLNAPLKVLAELAGSGNKQVLKAIAGRHCPQEMLDIIYESDDDEVFYHLAYNEVIPENMPEKLLVRLSEHELPSLRALVATAPGLPLYLMSRLARDISPTVRKALAKNPSASPSVLDLLSADSCADVRNLAIKNAARIQAEAKVAEDTPPARQLELFTEEDAFGDVDSNGESSVDNDDEDMADDEGTDAQEGGSLFKRLIKRMKGKKKKS